MSAGAAPVVSSARLANVACRTVHLIGFALLVGGVAAGAGPAAVQAPLWLTIASGLGLSVIETAASPRWIVEVRGVIVVAKLVLLGLVPWVPQHALALLVAVTVLASVGSHMPRGVRHCLLVRRAAWLRGPS